jgi:hypothetical protein
MRAFFFFLVKQDYLSLRDEMQAVLKEMDETERQNALAEC